MDEKNDNIIKKDEKTDEDDENDWESIPENEKTEETKDVLYRLNIEGASKVKIDLHRMKNYHSLKLKRLESKEIESINELDKYIKEKYMTNITINKNNNSNPYITILNNDYVLKKHPEIGTCLIYELDDINKEANLIGKSDTWYEATTFKPKILLKKPMNNTKSLGVPKISKNLIKKIKNEKPNKIGENKGYSNLINKKRKRKRKRKKIKYPKDSTVIEIKRIFDNKDKDEDDKNSKVIDQNIFNLQEQKEK